MSLLLDALKKSGSAHKIEVAGQAETGKQPEMSLEDLPDASASTAPVAGYTTVMSNRSTGENLFAAKKPPARPKFRYRLGVIPTAIIIGSVLAVAGGVYVWLEMQPPRSYKPNTVVAARVAPPPAISKLALAAELLPEPAPAARIERPAPVSANTFSSNKNTRSGSLNRLAPAPEETGIQFQRQPDTDDTYAALTAAYQDYQRGNMDAASRRYREVLQKDVRNRDALLGLAAIAQQQGQDSTAIHHYRQVLALDPRDPVAVAGLSAFASGNAAFKESQLKQSLSLSPQSAALHFALGNLYTEQSRWGDAQQAYFNAYRLEPASAQFAFNLATSMDRLGQKKLAVQYYEKALQLDTTGHNGFDRLPTQQRLNQLTTP